MQAVGQREIALTGCAESMEQHGFGFVVGFGDGGGYLKIKGGYTLFIDNRLSAYR